MTVYTAENYKHKYVLVPDYDGICHVCNSKIFLKEVIGTIIFTCEEYYTIIFEGMVLCGYCGAHLTLATIYRPIDIAKELSKISKHKQVPA